MEPEHSFAVAFVAAFAGLEYPTWQDLAAVAGDQHLISRSWIRGGRGDDLMSGETLLSSFGQDEVEDAMAAQPDDYLLELDSKTAEYLLVAAEVVVGRELPTPADLGREQYASLGLLIDVALKGES